MTVVDIIGETANVYCDNQSKRDLEMLTAAKAGGGLRSDLQFTLCDFCFSLSTQYSSEATGEVISGLFIAPQMCHYSGHQKKWLHPDPWITVFKAIQLYCQK